MREGARIEVGYRNTSASKCKVCLLKVLTSNFTSALIKLMRSALKREVSKEGHKL